VVAGLVMTPLVTGICVQGVVLRAGSSDDIEVAGARGEVAIVESAGEQEFVTGSDLDFGAGGGGRESLGELEDAGARAAGTGRGVIRADESEDLSGGGVDDGAIDDAVLVIELVRLDDRGRGS
jgi:hypothetical protein